jgi:hypothetical protein
LPHRDGLDRAQLRGLRRLDHALRHHRVGRHGGDRARDDVGLHEVGGGGDRHDLVELHRLGVDGLRHDLRVYDLRHHRRGARIELDRTPLRDRPGLGSRLVRRLLEHLHRDDLFDQLGIDPDQREQAEEHPGVNQQRDPAGDEGGAGSPGLRNLDARKRRHGHADGAAERRPQPEVVHGSAMAAAAQDGDRFTHAVASCFTAQPVRGPCRARRIVRFRSVAAAPQ